MGWDGLEKERRGLGEREQKRKKDNMIWYGMI